MNMKLKTLSMALLAMLGIQSVAALEVDREVMPRVTVGGRLIATPSAGKSEGFAATDDEEHSAVDISDSSLLLRFDKRLYDGGVAGAFVGFTKPDADSDLDDDIYFHQLNAFFWNKDFEAVLGRTRLPNTLIEFPTLRDDDLLSYTHVQNLTSFAENDQYQIYGDVVSLGWHINPTLTLSGWVGTRTETDATGDKLGEFNVNSAGFGLVYAQPEELAYLKRLRRAGILIDYQDVDDVTGDDSSYSAIAGAEWNLNNDPTRNWSTAVQAIYNDGLDGATLAGPNGLRRTESWSAAGSVRLTNRPKLLTRWQAGVTAAYKDYDEANASQFSIIPSFVYRLGSGVDLVSQVAYTNLDDGLAAVTGYDRDYSIMAGLSFSFDMKFNDTIGERTSILDTEHSYIRR
ncbi:hypothetical protein [Sulfuriflexus mobilis]|uniref:hypothetical protein n=1 Tax=Sulfuriflexus mobilis TaxID=1811807 RepID=UPI000F83D616|nr:hypothetical protein [Sulfuriflexus mobilis]